MKDQAELFEGFYKTWFDFNKKMMENSMEMSMELLRPEQYDKFYTQWSQHMSEMISKMMTAPGFTDKCWESFKASSGFYKFWQASTQEYFKNMNMPTREEYDELAARMDYFDDQLAEMKKMMKEISEKKKAEVQ